MRKEWVVEWWGGGRGKALRLIGLSKAFLWLALVKAFLSHLTSIPDLYVHIYHGIHIIGMYLPVQVPTLWRRPWGGINISTLPIGDECTRDSLVDERQIDSVSLKLLAYNLVKSVEESFDVPAISYGTAGTYYIQVCT
jgi:hypothetical protein